MLDKQVFTNWFDGVKRYLGPRGEPKEILEIYRRCAGMYHRKMKLLKDPVNLKTKKPLTKPGLTRRKKKIEQTKKRLLHNKQAVAFLHQKGYLNRNSKKSLYSQEILRRRKVKVLFIAIQELKEIEGHLRQVLKNQCELDRHLVWKAVEPAAMRTMEYIDAFMSVSMRPEKWPGINGSGVDLWNERAAGKDFEGNFSSLLE